MPHHPALKPGRVAVVTGAALGIGRASALALARLGMRLVLADRDEVWLAKVRDEVAAVSQGGAASVRAVTVDVADRAAVERLRDVALGEFGEVALLMNNAAARGGGGPLENADGWRRLIEVNLMGVLHGVQVFAPPMIAQGAPGAIVNTGSKQGITTPPGDTAYNVSKAGVKVLTEGLAHVLRNTPGCQVTAHLLIPGHTFVGVAAATGAAKPPGAWRADQVVSFMLERLAAGDFYILCPDNDVDRGLDCRRMQWAIDDIIENRPALSRWHPDYAEAFAAFVAEGRSDDPPPAGRGPR